MQLFQNLLNLKIIKKRLGKLFGLVLDFILLFMGLKNAGLWLFNNNFKRVKLKGETIAVLGTGFIATFLSAIMNNMPTIMIMDIALADIGNQAMIYANIVGCNLGPKMTPFGSLATLLWLHVLAKKV